MTSLPTALPRFGRQRGISLIELMIGMLLGLILLAGVILMFTSGNEVNRNRQAMSLISDNARFALEHMSRHLRMADPESVEWANETLSATLETGSEISYKFEVDDDGKGRILFDNGSDSESLLVDGIYELGFFFGIGDSNDKTLTYKDAPVTSSALWSIRPVLTLEDPAVTGNPLKLGDGNKTVATTIALRNPLLAAVSGLDDDASTPGSGPTDGGDPTIPPDEEDPVEEDPVDEDPVDEEPPSPPPEEDEPLPDQQVLCLEDTAEISDVKNNAKVILNTVVGQGAFLGCDDKGKNRTCRGRASTKSSFSAIITVGEDKKDKKDEKTFELEFSCIRIQ